MQAEGGVIPFPDRTRDRPISRRSSPRSTGRCSRPCTSSPGPGDAAELMQDAFLKLWERWDTIDRIDDPTA